MFAIRTTLSKILGPLFSYTSYSAEIIADFYFDLELVTVESEISAAFVVSPNRSIGDVMWTIPRALYLLMYHLLTDSLRLLLFILITVFSPLLSIILWIRGETDLVLLLAAPFFLPLHLATCLIVVILTSALLILSPVTRLIATLFWCFDPNRLGADGETALTLAIKNGEDDKTLQAYIDNPRIDMTCCNRDGKLPLAIAVEKGNIFAVKSLMTHCESIEAEDMIQKWSSRTIMYEYRGLWERGTIENNQLPFKKLTGNVLIHATYALPIAVSQVNVPMVRLLLAYGAQTIFIDVERHLGPLVTAMTESSITIIQLVANTYRRYELMGILIEKSKNAPADEKSRLLTTFCFNHWCIINYKEAVGWAIYHGDTDRIDYIRAHYPIQLSDSLPQPKRSALYPHEPSVLDCILDNPLASPTIQRSRALTSFQAQLPQDIFTLLKNFLDEHHEPNESIYAASPRDESFITFLFDHRVNACQSNFLFQLSLDVKALSFEARKNILAKALATPHYATLPNDNTLDMRARGIAWRNACSRVLKWEKAKLLALHVPEPIADIVTDYVDAPLIDGHHPSIINSRENAIFFAATLLDHDTKMRFLQMFIQVYYLAEYEYDPVVVYYKSLHAHSFFGNPAVSSSGSPESAVTVERKSPTDPNNAVRVSSSSPQDTMLTCVSTHR